MKAGRKISQIQAIYLEWTWQENTEEHADTAFVMNSMFLIRKSEPGWISVIAELAMQFKTRFLLWMKPQSLAQTAATLNPSR